MTLQASFRGTVCICCLANGRWELLAQHSQGKLSSCQVTAADSCQTIPCLILSIYIFNAMLIIMASKCPKSFPLLQRRDTFMGLWVEIFPWFWFDLVDVCEQRWKRLKWNNTENVTFQCSSLFLDKSDPWWYFVQNMSRGFYFWLCLGVSWILQCFWPWWCSEQTSADIESVLCSGSRSHSINPLSAADGDLGSGLKLFGWPIDGTFIGNKPVCHLH